jgi:photosystem II stability/assembly factor-like uncharacterized protein
MINADTGWISAWLFPHGIILRTTDGFQTIENICSGTGETPAILYFFKEKYNGEYCGYILGGGDGFLSKTTNSGYNWQYIPFGGEVHSFSFINKDTGWVTYKPSVENDKIEFTSNGGINWTLQFYDVTGNYAPYIINAVTPQKIWCGLYYGGYKIFISTNGGNIWGSQTSPLLVNPSIYMVDSLIGFAWSNLVVRTTNGGGPITSIENISSNIPVSIVLKQNYPNPFNSSTTIEFDIPKSSIVNLVLYDILGKEVLKIIDSKELESGVYKARIDMIHYNLSSGIYFYKLNAFEKGTDKIFQITKKLIYNK